MKLHSNVTYLDKTFSRNQIWKFMLSSVETLVVHESRIQNVCLKINMSSVVKYGSFLVLVYFEDWKLLICGFSEFFILTLYFFQTYLTDEEFREVFTMSREEFYKLPAWKQVSRKKEVLLF